MALTSWKAFEFFTKEQVPVAADADGRYLFDNEITSLSTGSDSLFLGDSSGIVRVVSRALNVIRSFRAVDGAEASITHIKQIPATPLLVTISEDLSNDPILKVWALDKIEKRTGGPKCLCTIELQNGKRQFPVSAFVTLDDLSQVAVGFANGSVVVVRGDFIHDRGTKQRIVFESEDPVTGLEVKKGSTTILYIATTGRLSNLVISGKDRGQPARIIENHGCGVGCMTLDKETKDIIVVRDDAIYTYGPGGRGPSFAFDGPKKMVKMFKDYVCLVCPPRVALVSKSKALRRLGTDDVDDLFSATSFNLLDTDLRFIAHTESLPSQVKEIFVEWGELYLLTIKGQLFRYLEKPLTKKLEILYERNLYILAINLAQKHGVDELQQNIIFRKYGDHLYQKGDYDTAMQQYLRAIDNTEPSQVIRKFLDTQRIHNLIDYLEELHEHDRATSDHTTLLLNCYAKLKDTEKLDAFIKAPGELKFDLDTAIAMCRQGGFFEQAAYLAQRYHENELVVDILVEDAKHFTKAVDFISRLEAEVAYSSLMKYASVLLDHCPEETTQILIDYYTGVYRTKQDPPVIEETKQQPSSGAFQNLSALLPLPYMNRSAVDTPITSVEQNPTVADSTLTSEPEPAAPSYNIPKPRTAFSAFISHPQQFIRFLEALTAQSSLSPSDATDLTTTLFELYLTTPSPIDSNQNHTKALALLTSPSTSLPQSTTLLLSSLTAFTPGTTHTLSASGAYSTIFRRTLSLSPPNPEAVISTLQTYGPKDRSLYPLALSYFTSSPSILSHPAVPVALSSTLSTIATHSLLSPLQVISLLAASPAVSIGLIRPYLSSAIARARADITSNHKLVESYRAETAAKRAELQELSDPGRPLTFQGRRCASCGGGLDLPTVHFACRHSIHQRCLNSGAGAAPGQDTGAGLKDSGREWAGVCPVCAPGMETVRAIRRVQREGREGHDLFRAALENESGLGGGGGGRFGVVGEWFGRGVMGQGGEAGGTLEDVGSDRRK